MKLNKSDDTPMGSESNNNTDPSKIDDVISMYNGLVEKYSSEYNIDEYEINDKHMVYYPDFFETYGLDGIDMNDLSAKFENMFSGRKINFEVVSDKVVYPKYAYPSDSGFDLHSIEELTIPSFGRSLVRTGLKFSFDEGFELQIRPKSGLALKQGLTVLNTPGTVDQGYTGEVQVIVFNTTDKPVTITEGMKIAQAVLCPVMPGKYVTFEQVVNILDKDRGDNGFGSTGIS